MSGVHPRCLPRALTPDPETGLVTCAVVEATSGEEGCDYTARPGRTAEPLSQSANDPRVRKLDTALRDGLRNNLGVCDRPGKPDCSSFCLCEIQQASSAIQTSTPGLSLLDACKQGSSCPTSAQDGTRSPDSATSIIQRARCCGTALRPSGGSWHSSARTPRRREQPCSSRALGRRDLDHGSAVVWAHLQQTNTVRLPVMLRSAESKGKLRIGDDWNAIRIIALTQTNPLKAVAEMVENSIDAHARTVAITRGRERGEHYLAIRDDGDGVPRDDLGVPDFKYVATHICDSIKRRLKADGAGSGLQGEFGIGLLSFWTVGDRLVMTSTGADRRAYQMTMSKGDPSYQVTPRRMLFDERGTEIRISPLLEGIRTLSGEKIQWYLASELRDRIRGSGVRITVFDKLARKQFEVEPRQFDGRLLHTLPAVRTAFGDAYVELYISEPAESSRVALYRSGTRVIELLTSLPGLDHMPWTSGYIEGLLDAPFLSVTPGTRSGIVHDERYAALCDALSALEEHLNTVIDEQKRAEEEQTSRQLMRAIQRAFREALLALPPEEYDWFDIQARARTTPGARETQGNGGGTEGELDSQVPGVIEPEPAQESQRHFFEHPGPLFSVLVSPMTSTVAVNESRRFKALARDRSRRRVEEDLQFFWEGVEGGGTLSADRNQEIIFTAPAAPELIRLRVTVTQGEITCTADALVTVTDTLASQGSTGMTNARGLPGYTFERAAGELWRSRFDADRNVIVVNNGHRDFVFASRSQSLKLRYLIRLYIKELVLRNFAGLPVDKSLERMVELSLYTEEKL